MDRRRLGQAIAAVAAVASLPRLADLPAAAQTKALTDAQDVNNAPGIVAEIVQCKRAEGVLSIRMRLRNTGDQNVKVTLVRDNNYDQYYVTAASKKYLLLRDSEQHPLANPPTFGMVTFEIPRGGSALWYAKYPAPPAEVKKVSYYTTVAPPFEDIPVSD